MARPTKHANTICLVLSIVAALGAIAGFWRGQPLIVVGGLLPAVIYEVYRTEGRSTRWASWALLGLLALEALVLWFHVSLDLGALLGSSAPTVAGYQVPVGDIKVVGPAAMAVLSVILMARTRGRYTKWLAAIILLTSLALIYIIDRTVFARWVQIAVQLVRSRLQ